LEDPDLPWDQILLRDNINKLCDEQANCIDSVAETLQFGINLIEKFTSGWQPIVKTW